MVSAAPGPAPTAVITIVHGRHRHLREQLRSLRRTTGGFVHVVVAMGDPQVPEVVREALASADGGGAVSTQLHAVEPDVTGELPLAAARNLGADRAIAAGADLLVFLDVDCLAGPGLVRDYRAAVARPRPPEPVLWCGEVAYLPPLPAGVERYPLDELDDWAEPHAARPVLPPGTVQHSADLRLFWSLNFAVTAADWRQLGGFHPGYTGYGGEDTDLAAAAGALGGTIGWVGGARVHHQHHPTSSPPWQHLPAIVRNARLFHERWGRFPMEGWLTAFADAGAVEYRPDAGVLRLVPGEPRVEERVDQARTAGLTAPKNEPVSPKNDR